MTLSARVSRPAIETDPRVIAVIESCNWDDLFLSLELLFEFSDDDETLMRHLAKRPCIRTQLAPPMNPKFKPPVKLPEKVTKLSQLLHKSPPKLKLTQLAPMTNKPFKPPRITLLPTKPSQINHHKLLPTKQPQPDTKPSHTDYQKLLSQLDDQFTSSPPSSPTRPTTTLLRSPKNVTPNNQAQQTPRLSQTAPKMSPQAKLSQALNSSPPVPKASPQTLKASPQDLKASPQILRASQAPHLSPPRPLPTTITAKPTLPLRQVIGAVFSPSPPSTKPSDIYTSMFGQQITRLRQQQKRTTIDLSSSSPSRAYSTKANAHIFLSTQKAPVPTTATTEDGEVVAPLTKLKRPMILSLEQEYILHKVLSGKSLFYTGLAGTGKLVLLREIIKALRLQRPGVAVTALTGLAACNIGGMTLHSFAGVGLAKELVQSLYKKLHRNRKAKNRWMTTQVLVIDEVSMVDGEFFNKLDALAKKVRKLLEPFGGIQLVLCGDFFQLPPITRREDDGEYPETKFAFESEAWLGAITHTYTLTEVFRQQSDQQFVDILNELRLGQVLQETEAELKRLSRPLKSVGGIEPADLHPRRAEVDRSNNSRLALIKGETQVYNCVDAGSLTGEQRAKVLGNMLALPRLVLKRGAQVMCIKNIDDTLVNGTLGTVIDFVDRETYMRLLGIAEDDEDDSDFVQPLIYSDEPLQPCAERDPTLISEQYAAHGTELALAKLDQVLPLVQFRTNDGNFRYHLMEPEKWLVEDETGHVLALRLQIPLILAWSLLIHKSQGQTLPLVRVNLALCFEMGQAYVALSRAVSREGLQVIGFSRDRVRCHPKVLEFYLNLDRANAPRKRTSRQATLPFDS